MLSAVRPFLDHISTNTSRSNHNKFYPSMANYTGRARIIENLARTLGLPFLGTPVVFFLFIHPSSLLKENSSSYVFFA